MSVCHSIWLLIRALFRNRAELAVGNLALRNQMAILKSIWRSILVIAQRDTVVDRVVAPRSIKFVRRDLSDPARKCSTHQAEPR